MKLDAATGHADIEPCCEHCRAEIEKQPEWTLLVREKCIFENKVTNYVEGGALNWD